LKTAISSDRKTRKKLLLAVAALFLFTIAGLGLWAKNGIFTPLSIHNTDREVIFLIRRGQGLNDVAVDLAETNLIKSPFLFKVAAVISHRQSRLQAGVYNLSPSLSAWQILRKIAAGDILKEKLTILEGWDVHDIANYLEQKHIFSRDDFLLAAKSGDKELQNIFDSESFLSFDFSGSNGYVPGLEGFLFPDTYEFIFGSSISNFLREMLANFKTKISDDLKAEIKRQGKSLYDVLIMASLLEKEVKTYSDKQVVAGILWKRLANGWPLQVDATINYALDKPNSKLSLDDLQFNSPYNTYIHKGLPPGPICNPGMESIKAAVYYKESPYWYYLSKPNGATIFSTTFEQHKAAKAK